MGSNGRETGVALTEAHVRALADVLGETDRGMSGSEIGRLLQDCGFPDPTPGATKRHRLAEALLAKAASEGSTSRVLRLIRSALDPVRYHNNPTVFEERRAGVNHVLAFAGVAVDESGALTKVTAVRTLTEAQARRKRMFDEMLRRGVHAEVIKYCRTELLSDDCFDAVFEATKGLAERIRDMTGLTSDGGELIDGAFAAAKSPPMIAFNRLQTQSETSEQSGLQNLMKGVFGAFRNPTAHAAKIKWGVTEADALDLLTTLSLVHRRLDTAVVLRTAP